MSLFDRFRKRSENKNIHAGEQEFTFIWYKKLQTGGKTIYTQPFRTAIKAKNIAEAKDKLTNFVLGKMTLEIYEEHEYGKTDLSYLQKKFDELNKQMGEFFDRITKS